MGGNVNADEEEGLVRQVAASQGGGRRNQAFELENCDLESVNSARLGRTNRLLLASTPVKNLNFLSTGVKPNDELGHIARSNHSVREFNEDLNADIIAPDRVRGIGRIGSAISNAAKGISLKM